MSTQPTEAFQPTCVTNLGKTEVRINVAETVTLLRLTQECQSRRDDLRKERGK